MTARLATSLATLIALVATATPAQIVENPGDPFGIAIPHPRVRLVHSLNPIDRGSSAYLRTFDPFLFYQTGRDLLHRQFELVDGALQRPAEATIPLYVGLAADHPALQRAPRFARDHAPSCGLCHNSVYREPGAGPTIASTGGLGRNSTHFYGGGLVEMLGEQITAMVLETYDRDRNGVIDRSEAAPPAPVERIRPQPGAAPIDFGDLSADAHGVPRLNSAFRVWYVDSDGSVLRDAYGLDDQRVEAFGLSMQPFGWGRGRLVVDGRSIAQGGEASTVREFYSTAAEQHMGLQAYDPTQLRDNSTAAGVGGASGVSLNGAQQFDFGGSVDRGAHVGPSGVSLADPDGDGTLGELTEGDLDAIEFYMLHAPAPAKLVTPSGERGHAILERVGCTRCHIETWRIEAADEQRGLTGDRRFFNLETSSGTGPSGELEVVGRIRSLTRTRTDGGHEPLRTAFLVEGIYTDFKHWDLGPQFHELRFDGSVQRLHRTAPLWGVGSSSPFGHSGGFMTLEDVIGAHGGAAAAETAAYLALQESEREDLFEFLRNLVLYATDEIPSDIDDDGVHATAFQVDGQTVGYERFDARFLFRTPPRYRYLGRLVDPNGRLVPVGFITNVMEAYGLLLPFRVDKNGDGFPDILAAGTSALGGGQ